MRSTCERNCRTATLSPTRMESHWSSVERASDGPTVRSYCDSGMLCRKRAAEVREVIDMAVCFIGAKRIQISGLVVAMETKVELAPPQQKTPPRRWGSRTAVAEVYAWWSRSKCQTRV